MTIANNASLRKDYVGDGATTVYPYDFEIFASTDLTVYLDGVLTTAYTVSGVGVGTGGNVTFTTAPGNTVKIAILSGVPYGQPRHYVDNGAFSLSGLESDLDRVTALSRQILEITKRAVKFADFSTYANIVFPELIASKYLRVKSDLSGLELVDITTSGTYVNPITTLGDLLQGGAGGVAERLALGSNGKVLVVDPSTGKAGWRESPLLALTNNTGVALAAGDVVALGIANNEAVELDDTQASVRTFVVALTAPANAAVGLFLQCGGAVTAKAQGAIARGEYVRKSATTKALETTGVASSSTSTIPSGTIGVATSAAAAGVVKVVLFGSTKQVPAVDVAESFSGLGLSNDAVSPNTVLDIASGACSTDDATIANRVLMTLSAFTKTTAAWAVGTGNGGMASGAAVAANTWYHVFVIQRTDTSVVDVAFDTSVTGANIAANTNANYTRKRRIGSFKTATGTTNILAFSQEGDEFRWSATLLDYNVTNPGTAAVTVTLTVPTGVKVVAFVNAQFYPGTNAGMIYLSSLDQNDESIATSTGATGAAPLATTGTPSGQMAGFAFVRTNTSGQIRSRVSISGVADQARVATLGWIDRRGRG